MTLPIFWKQVVRFQNNNTILSICAFSLHFFSLIFIFFVRVVVAVVVFLFFSLHVPLINKLESYIVSHRIYILYMVVNVYCMPRVSFAFEIINVNLKIIFARLRIYDFNGDLASLLDLKLDASSCWQSNSLSMVWQPFSSMFHTPLTS